MEKTEIAVETVEETAAEKPATEGIAAANGRAVPECKIGAEGAGRDLAAEFEELIRGEYKDVFAARVKSILIRRFRERTRDGEAAPDAADGRGAEALPTPSESEIEALVRDYPDFSLETEAADPTFGRLMAAGADLRTAYEFTHRDTLMPRALRSALEAELARIGGEPGSAAERISEGSLGSAAAPLGTDTASRAAREALERRALRGEKIIL